MMPAFIVLTFEWLWLIIIWVIVGTPLFVILMVWRIVADAGWARRWAIGAVVGVATTLAGLWLYLDDGDRSYALSVTLMTFGLGTIAATWLASALSTRRGVVWADLLTLLIPTVFGLFVWYVE